MKTEIRPENEMKDSGIEYVGEIPKDWDLERLRVYFCERKNKNREGNEDNLLSLSYGRIIRKNIDKTDGLLPASFNTYNIVEKNDIIIRPTDLQNDKRSLRTGLVTEHGIITSAYIDLMPIGTVDSKFFHYLLHSYDILKVFYNMGSGVRQGLNYSEFSKLKVPMPSLSEQQAIADYLDETCSKIDEIIAEAKASIDEYKELKKSVITNITTHGLRDVSLINSGNMDIGMIPDTWSICKTLYGLAMPITDGPHVTPELLDDGIAFISAEAVSCGRGSIDFNHMRGYISEEFYNECCKKYVPQRDDIYMIKSGATTGTVSIVDTDRKFTIWSPLAVFRVNRDRLNPRYLFYFLQSKSYQQQVQLGWTFGTQQNIGMRTLEQLKICLPPLGEQAEIVEYLDNKLPQIDSLIIEKEALIADLEAYKKSLIYELVTGKRRVV